MEATPANPAGLTREQAIRAAALAARAYQTNPTTDLFTTMLAATDRATELGATRDDIATAITAA